MKTLIRIVFVIFIANGIDCLGGVCKDCCDNCCDCFKGGIKEDEEIKENEKIGGEGEEEKKEDEKKEDENITAESLVNGFWLDNKKGLVLMIFKKEKNDNVFTSTENGNEFSFKLDESNKLKKTDQNENEDELKLENKLNLGEQTYALFEIKPKDGNTVYLYCSDVESSDGESSDVESNEDDNECCGIFEETTHVSISVIACDTENVMNMAYMFYACDNLTELDLKNFNTTKVTNMKSMFSSCNSLKEIDIKNFNTTKVTNMQYMFYKCRSLKNLKFGDNFNTTNIKDKKNKYAMFGFCKKLPKKIRNKFSNKNI